MAGQSEAVDHRTEDLDELTSPGEETDHESDDCVVHQGSEGNY